MREPCGGETKTTICSPCAAGDIYSWMFGTSAHMGVTRGSVARGGLTSEHVGSAPRNQVGSLEHVPPRRGNRSVANSWHNSSPTFVLRALGISRAEVHDGFPPKMSGSAVARLASAHNVDGVDFRSNTCLEGPTRCEFASPASRTLRFPSRVAGFCQLAGANLQEKHQSTPPQVWSNPGHVWSNFEIVPHPLLSRTPAWHAHVEMTGDDALQVCRVRAWGASAVGRCSGG